MVDEDPHRGIGEYEEHNAIGVLEEDAIDIIVYGISVELQKPLEFI